MICLAKVSVMGTGSWGTALAILLHNNGHEVILWSAHEAKAEELAKKREDASKLPGIKIPEGILITGDEKKALGRIGCGCFCISICLYAKHK